MLKTTAFGKNDIRGIYGDDITEELFYYTGRGFVQYLVKEAKDCHLKFGLQYAEMQDCTPLLFQNLL